MIMIVDDQLIINLVLRASKPSFLFYLMWYMDWVKTPCVKQSD